jgi:hypothetical protein
MVNSTEAEGKRSKEMENKKQTFQAQGPFLNSLRLAVQNFV